MGLSVRATLAALLLLIGLASYLPIVRLHGPYPLVLVGSTTLLKIDTRLIIALLVPVMFWLSSARAMQSTMPPRIAALVGLSLIVLSAAYFASRWSAGLAYQGPPHTLFWAAVNGLAAVCLAVCVIYAWDRPGSLFHVLSHFILVGWIGFLAFPYLGVPPRGAG